MKKASILLLLLVMTLTLAACTSLDNTTPQQRTLALTGLNKVAFTSASGSEIGKNISHPAYEIYTIDKPEALQKLEKSIKHLTKTTDNPDNIAYTATFLLATGAPIQIWFSFPDKIWLKEPDGKMQCWAVEGEFSNIISKILKNVPIRYKGEIGLHGVTKQLMLFVFDKPYSLYIAPQDEAKIKGRLGEAALIVGRPFVNNNEDYIEVVYAEVIPSAKITGELKVWLSGDLALKTDSNEYYLLHLDNIQKSALKHEINQRIKITGTIHNPDSNFARKNVILYYYRKFIPSPSGAAVGTK